MYSLNGGYLGQLARARMAADKGGSSGGAGSGTGSGSADQGTQGGGKGAGAGEDDAETGDDSQAGEDGDESDDEPVSYSKAELDELLAKERRKAIREFKKQKHSRDAKDPDPGKSSGGDSKDAEAVRRVQERERMADQAIIQSTAYTVAAELGIDPRKLSIAVRAADLDDVSVNSKGRADKEAIRDALEEILEMMPELKTSAASGAAGPAKETKVIKNKLADGKKTTGFTREDVAKMSPDEINANWDKIKNMKL